MCGIVGIWQKNKGEVPSRLLTHIRDTMYYRGPDDAEIWLAVANYTGVYPLNKQQLLEWSILDTFDMFSPAYDLPQTEKTVRGWFGAAGFLNSEIMNCGLIVGRGVKGQE